jgi:hypothetical protein
MPIQYHVNVRRSWCKYWLRLTPYSFFHPPMLIWEYFICNLLNFHYWFYCPHAVPILYFWTHGPAFEYNFWWHIPSDMNLQVQNIYYWFFKENNAIILNVLIAVLYRYFVVCHPWSMPFNFRIVSDPLWWLLSVQYILLVLMLSSVHYWCYLFMAVMCIKP